MFQGLVQDYLNDEAKQAWETGKWKGRVRVPDLMNFLTDLKNKDKDWLATCADVEAFIASSERTSVGRPDILAHLDEQATQAWRDGKWKGRLNISILFEVLINHLPKGAKVTTEDIDKFVAEGERRRKENDELLDWKADPKAKPDKCGCRNHRGSNEPFQPMMRYIKYFDTQLKKMVRKRHPVGDKAEIREGQFLASAEQQIITLYCDRCKLEANARREEKRVEALAEHVLDCESCKKAGDPEIVRKQATSHMYENRELPPRLVWYTAEAAKRKLDAKVEADQKAGEAENFEDATANEFIQRRSMDMQRSRGDKGSRGNSYRR